MRMASDVVRDLELDQPHDGINFAESRANPELMNNIRTYLAAQYLCSGFAANWQKTQNLPFQNWTATCCDILASNSDDPTSGSDQTLAWLVRVQHLVAQLANLTKRGRRGGELSEQDEEPDAVFMVKGMEVQLREIQGLMPPDISPQRKNFTYQEIRLLVLLEN